MRTKALSKRRPSIDKSELQFGLDQKWEDRSYLDSIREARCIVTGRYGSDDESIDPSHIRLGFYGAGMKPGDYYALPLTHSQHLRQHNIGEGNYWLQAVNEHPVMLAEFIKGYATLRYIKHMLGGDMSDREVVKRVKEMVG